MLGEVFEDLVGPQELGEVFGGPGDALGVLQSPPTTLPLLVTTLFLSPLSCCHHSFLVTALTCPRPSRRVSSGWLLLRAALAWWP